MMNQFEVPLYIAGRLPQIKNELARNGNNGNIYQSIRVLTDYTKRMATEHDFKMLEKCMSLVERIYSKGTSIVKGAIENIFIFSFSSMMSLCSIVEWKIVQSYMPAQLYTLYMQQVLRSKD